MTVEITFRIVTGNHDENLGLESALEMNAPREFIYLKKNKKSGSIQFLSQTWITSLTAIKMNTKIAQRKVKTEYKSCYLHLPTAPVKLFKV